MAEVLEYDPKLITDAYRLWRASGRLPSKGEINALIAMPDDERHTFVNDLVEFESMGSMKQMSSLIDDRIKQLVARRQYDAARRLIHQYPDDPKAQQYLQDIDALETPIDRGATSAMKWMAYAGLVFMFLLIAFVVLIGLGLR